MKKKTKSTSSVPVGLSPIKIALFIAFGLIAIVIGYAALNTSTNMQSKANEDKVCHVVKGACTPIMKNGKKVGQNCDHTVVCTPKAKTTPKPKCTRLCDGNGPHASCGGWSCPPGVAPPSQLQEQ